MAKTVTVSKLRENLSTYLDMVNEKGTEVEIVDGRKGKVLATLVKKKEDDFDWDEYLEFVESIGGGGLLASKEDEDTRKKFRKATNERLKKNDW